jgi:hypothetical protein
MYSASDLKQREQVDRCSKRVFAGAAQKHHHARRRVTATKKHILQLLSLAFFSWMQLL